MKSRYIFLAFAVAFHVSAALHYVDVNSINPISPYTNWSTAATNIQDAVNSSLVNDVVLVTNGIYQYGLGSYYYGSNRVALDKAITLQSINGPLVTTIQGYQVPSTVTGDSAVRCVYITSGAVLTGFTLTNGSTTSYGGSGGGVYSVSPNTIVSNCIICNNRSGLSGGGAIGGTIYNCVLTGNISGDIGGGNGEGGGAASSSLYNCIVVSNTGGFSYSSGEGGGLFNCPVVNNCSISNNIANSFGGGVANSTLSNCIINNNSIAQTRNGGGGGGAYEAILVDCIVSGNSNVGTGNYAGFGGGCYSCRATNCTITGNFADIGGGISGNTANISKLSNCIIYYNTASASPNWDYEPTLRTPVFSFSSCCTYPLALGTGNITNDPLVVSLVIGDLHLQSNSPCINAGRNSYIITNSGDLDGNPRIVGGTVDIGAYEYQTPTSVLSYAWAQQYGLPIDGSADYLDSDGDGMNNWQEWKAGTNPTDSASVLLLASPITSISGVMLTWQSVTNATYYLQSSTNLPTFTSIKSNLVGQFSSTSYTDITATNGGPYFYRIGVQ